jgi:DDE family transposase
MWAGQRNSVWDCNSRLRRECPLHDGLQSLQPAEPTGDLDGYFLRPDRIDRHGRIDVGGFQLHQSPSLRGRRKRGPSTMRSAARAAGTDHQNPRADRTPHQGRDPAKSDPQAHRYDKTAYKGRNVIERMFCRLKDFRRIATRYDKRADIFLSAIPLAAAITWRINRVRTLAAPPQSAVSANAN